MDDSVQMRHRQHLRHPSQQYTRLGRRERLLRKSRRQVLAFQPLHHQIGLRVELTVRNVANDARMSQLRQHADFPIEARDFIGLRYIQVQQLQRHKLRGQ